MQPAQTAASQGWIGVFDALCQSTTSAARAISPPTNEILTAEHPQEEALVCGSDSASIPPFFRIRTRSPGPRSRTAAGLETAPSDGRWTVSRCESKFPKPRPRAFLDTRQHHGSPTSIQHESAELATRIGAHRTRQRIPAKDCRIDGSRSCSNPKWARNALEGAQMRTARCRKGSVYCRTSARKPNGNGSRRSEAGPLE